MKKALICVIAAFLAIALCSCGKVNVDTGKIVELVYYYDDVSVDVELSEEESRSVLEIFNGKELFFDNPSGGFNDKISLRIFGHYYCPACDGSCTVMDRSSLQYFTISKAERETIDRVFEAHGGHFPCE